MRWAIAAAALAACGGQILDAPSDSGVDASQKADASKDVSPPIDVGVFDVTGVDDTTNPPLCQISTTSLVAYYPLDADTTDQSGHGNHATGQNLSPIAGLVGGAMRWNGTSSVMKVTNGTATLSGPRTLCAWSRSNPTTGAGQPLFWGGSTNQGDFYSFFSSAPSNTTCTKTMPSVPFVDHWGTDCIIEPSLPPIMFGQWTLICYAFDGGAVEVSVNGFEDKAAGALYDYPLTTLFVGSTAGGGTTTKPSLDGDIDEVSIWSTRLQSGELAALWNHGFGCKL